jgi:hypothetical protein
MINRTALEANRSRQSVCHPASRRIVCGTLPAVELAARIELNHQFQQGDLRIIQWQS